MKNLILLICLTVSFSLCFADPIRPVGVGANPASNITNINNSIDNSLSTFATLLQAPLAINAVTTITYTFQAPVTGLFQINLRMNTGLLSQITEANLAQGIEIKFYDAGNALLATYNGSGFVLSDVAGINGNCRLLMFSSMQVQTISISFKKLVGIFDSDIDIFDIRNDNIAMNLATHGADISGGLLSGTVFNPQNADVDHDPNTEFATFQFPLLDVLGILGTTAAKYDWLPANPAGTFNGIPQSVYLTIEGQTALDLAVLGELNITLYYADNSSATYALSDPVVKIALFQGTNKRLVEVPMSALKNLKDVVISKSDLLSVDLLNDINLYNVFTGDASTVSLLPVKLSYFAASKLQSAALLNWSTASEENSGHFEIERSATGNTFLHIATVQANGAGNAVNNYTFTDDAPLQGVNLYRLKIVDRDGKFEYSDVKKVEFDKNSSPATVYPNPVKDRLQIKDLHGNNQFELFNSEGKLVKTAASSSPATDIDVSTLSKGCYLLKIIRDNEFSTVIKVLKQ